MPDPWTIETDDGRTFTLPGDVPQSEIGEALAYLEESAGVTGAKVKYKPYAEVGPLKVEPETYRMVTDTMADVGLSGGGAMIGAPAGPVGAIGAGAIGAGAAPIVSDWAQESAGIAPSGNNPYNNVVASVGVDLLVPPALKGAKNLVRWGARAGKSVDEVAANLRTQRAAGAKPTMASATKSPAHELLWDYGSKSIWGNNQYRRQLDESIAGARGAIEDHFARDVHGVIKPTAGAAGATATAGPSAYKDFVMQTEVTPAYNSVWGRVPEETTIPLDPVRAFLDEKVVDAEFKAVLNAPGMERIKIDFDNLFTSTKEILAMDEMGKPVVRELHIDEEASIGMIRDIKRRVGERAFGSWQADNPIYKQQLRDFYSALDESIEMGIDRVARLKGDETLVQDYRLANKRYTDLMDELRGLTPLANKATDAAGWTTTRNMIMNGSVDEVRALKQGVLTEGAGDPSGWYRIRDAQVRDMGFSKDMENFDLAKFYNSYHNMEDGMKDVVFGQNTPLRKALNNFSEVVGLSPGVVGLARASNASSAIAQGQRAERSAFSWLFPAGAGAIGGPQAAAVVFALDAIGTNAAMRMMQNPKYLDMMVKAAKMERGGVGQFVAKAPVFMVENAISDGDADAGLSFLEALAEFATVDVDGMGILGPGGAGRPEDDGFLSTTFTETARR